MRLSTVRTSSGTAVARAASDHYVLLPYPHLTELLRHPDWQRRAAGDGEPTSSADLAPAAHPGKIFCVGLNYRRHIEETGRPTPEQPTLFAKFTDSLTGPLDDIALPAVSHRMDWEAELGVIIGRPAHRVDPASALDHVAGYCVVNDVSMRDWQNRTSQWLQGKSFEACTPVGPAMVTPEEIDHAKDLEIVCSVDDEVMQSSRTSDLLFDVPFLVSYISQITTLRPGDLIATGTPGGVGNARTPQRFLQPGDVLTTRIEGIGALSNRIVEE